MGEVRSRDCNQQVPEVAQARMDAIKVAIKEVNAITNVEVEGIVG